MTMWSVAVLGHSFVSRAHAFVHSYKEGSAPNLTLQDTYVSWMGFSGLYITGLRSLLHLLISGQPDIVIVDIASNDLCDPFANPLELAQITFDVAAEMLSAPSVRCVYLMAVCPRAPWASYPARGDFNQCALIYNERLRELCTASPLPISCAPVRGIWDNFESYLAADGVHLCQSQDPTGGPSGIFKYIMSVRRAIVRGVQYCNNN